MFSSIRPLSKLVDFQQLRCISAALQHTCNGTQGLFTLLHNDCITDRKSFHSRKWSSNSGTPLLSNVDVLGNSVTRYKYNYDARNLQDVYSKHCRFHYSGGSGDDEVKAEVKGFFIRIPNPVEWVRDRACLFFIKNWLDSEFKMEDFVYGAKQALSYLTRLAVMKDFDTMKQIAAEEVVTKVQDMLTPWSDEQQRSIEILVSDISLASANISSVSRDSETYKVVVDVFCVALKTYKSRPLLVQMTLRFSRCYGDNETSTDWTISSILEFKVREMLKE